MKKLNNSHLLSVTMVYRPLATSLKIKADKNLPTSQFYYQSALEWLPDHRKEPEYDENGAQVDGLLRLLAEFFIQDEDDLIDPEDLQYEVRWFVNGTQVSDPDTSKDYYTSGHDLCVKKNLTHLESATIRCDLEFTDPRDSKKIIVSDTLVLNGILKAKDAWQINLLCDRTRKHYPLTTENTIYDFEAEIRQGAILRNDEVKWFWDYSTDNGVTYNNITTGLLWYVSGLGTNKLTIDMDYIEDVMVRCRVASKKTLSNPDMPNEATASMSWRWPALKVDVFSYGGNRIFAENTSMRFGFFVHILKHDDMTEAQKNKWLLTSWQVRKQGSVAAPVYLDAHGMEVDIAQRFLLSKSLEKFIPDPNIGIRGVYDVVGFHDGQEIQLSNGQTFAIRT